MSRLRLLTTGKSLVGLKESESRYRVARERFLPQFGPVKNPFATNDRSEPARPEASRKTEWPSAPSPQPTKLAPSPAGKPSDAQSVACSKLTAVLTDSSRPASKSGLRSWGWATGVGINWAEKIRTLFSRSAGKPAKVALSSPTRLPVQGELSLERIKVVRNDLSDADLEIVPLKSPTARAGVTPLLRVVESTAQGGMTWGRFSGIFGAGKR